jgi:hypothetical protein
MGRDQKSSSHDRRRTVESHEQSEPRPLNVCRAPSALGEDSTAGGRVRRQEQVRGDVTSVAGLSARERFIIGSREHSVRWREAMNRKEPPARVTIRYNGASTTIP